MRRLLRNKRVRLLTATLLIVCGAWLAGIPLRGHQEQPGLNGFYRVMQVYDGDTIAVLMNGKRVTVRLIGIDTPEVNTPYTKAACFGTEASAAARALLHDKDVRIQTDPSQDTYDIYDRLLAYVYVPTDDNPGGISANEYLIREGFAREYTFKKPYAHIEAHKADEAAAREAKKGLWNACLPAQAGESSS